MNTPKTAKRPQKTNPTSIMRSPRSSNATDSDEGEAGKQDEHGAIHQLREGQKRRAIRDVESDKGGEDGKLECIAALGNFFHAGRKALDEV